MKCRACRAIFTRPTLCEDSLAPTRTANLKIPGFLGLVEPSHMACIYNLLQRWHPTSVPNLFFLSILEARCLHEDVHDATSSEAHGIEEMEKAFFLAQILFLAQIHVAHHLAWAYVVLNQGASDCVKTDEKKRRRGKKKPGPRARCEQHRR
ncbi:hypothetical protein B0H10DRAFT_1969081 [Mycena sp. CBHHK59/15]|nr:hypothetical protein B0H10DRAFT_1969081 [Mycena sp. CBHHK59/15]